VQELPTVVTGNDGSYETTRIPPIPFSLDYPFITTKEEEEPETDKGQTSSVEIILEGQIVAASVGK
jgi:hypothetical protein